MPAPTLCKTCLDCLCNHKNLMSDDPEHLFFFHHFEPLTLEASANTNCPICVQLWKQFEPIQSQVPGTSSKEDPLTYLLLLPDDLLKIEGAYFLQAAFEEDATTVHGVPHTSQVLFQLQPVEDTIESLYIAKELEDSTRSMTSWDVVLQWLLNCSSGHDECAVADEPPSYPTRLLDIGSHSNDPIRLVVSAESKPSGGYVTLSHCWGNSINLKLSKNNFTTLRSGIDVGILPLTFQDAVEVTRRLKKRYIWIDCLCIFQDDDDKSDWLQEAALMNKVYAYSFLNIAATGVKDSSGGLFQTRDRDFELKPVRVACPKSVLDSRGPGATGEFIMTDFFLFERELMNAPLNKRGWVLQERLLAARVLHFGRGQLFWECRRGVLCERYPENIPPCLRRTTNSTLKSMDISKKRSNKPGITYANEVPLGKNSDLIIFNLWNDVIKAYSETRLTFESDKAIALSGIAKVMRNVFADEFVAGLWRRCLEGQLLWHVDDTQQADFKSSTRSFPYRAPTWSWLSVDGKITPGKCLREGICMKVLDFTLKHATNDTTGLIVDGSLTLVGRLRRLKIRTRELTDSKHGVQVEVKGQWTLTVGGKDLEVTREGLEPWEKIGTLTFLDVPHTDFHESNKREELFIMSGGGPWMTADDPFTGSDVHPYHEMLLLKCVDRESGVFHRFGVASIDTHKNADVWSLMQEYDADEAELPCVFHDKANHLHTIVLR